MGDRQRGEGPPLRGPRRQAGASVRGRDPSDRSPLKTKVDDLVRTTGIPRQLAFQVAMGNLALNDVLERLAREDRAQALVERHGLDRSVAVQIALGQASLENVLRKKRLDAHLVENRRRSVLHEAAADGRRLAIAVHGRQVLRGRVRSVSRYDFEFEPVDEDATTVHKLQAKFAHTAEDWKLLEKGVSTDASRDADAEPVSRPQDRFAVSDKQLFAFHEDKTLVVATTLEGDRLTGMVTWLGRWEFGMHIPRKKHAPDGAEIVVFRHALADLRSA